MNVTWPNIDPSNKPLPPDDFEQIFLHLLQQMFAAAYEDWDDMMLTQKEERLAQTFASIILAIKAANAFHDWLEHWMRHNDPVLSSEYEPDPEEVDFDPDIWQMLNFDAFEYLTSMITGDDLIERLSTTPIKDWKRIERVK